METSRAIIEIVIGRGRDEIYAEREMVRDF